MNAKIGDNTSDNIVQISTNLGGIMPPNTHSLVTRKFVGRICCSQKINK